MTNQCGNPNDTGQQLMAANIGYDQTVTGLSAAHVQAAIDALYDITGLGYHPNFTGREEADQHPQEAITGLVDSLAGKANTGHSQAASTVTYDNASGDLVAIQVQAAIDELAAVQAAGVEEWSAVAIEVVPAEGIAASVNQMDWTGHAHADPTVTTALRIDPQDIITFSNSTGTLYRWIGVKGVLVGLGGNYSTLTGDYEATGSDDHSALSNRTAVDSHPQAAITDLVTDQATQDTSIGTNATNHTNHLADLANPHVVTAAQVGAEPANVNIQAHIGATNNPHSVTAAQLGIVTGFKNVLLNGDFRVNQRGVGSHQGSGVYGYDRWKGHASGIEQVIEQANLITGTYTLSWAGGGNGTFNGTTAASPITESITPAGNMSVIVPNTSTDIQLELGATATAFEVRSLAHEVSMCRRYFFQLRDNTNSQVSLMWGRLYGTTDAELGFVLPTEMRIAPSTSFSNLSNFGLYDGAADSTLTVFGAQNNTTTRAYIAVEVGVALTAHRVVYIFSNIGTATIQFDSEI